MNDIENRLRDAYRGATDTVRPEAIRGLGEHATVISASSRWLARGKLHGLLVPLTAAAAVLVVGVAAAVVVPDALHDARNQGSGATAPLAGNPATHFLVGLADTNANYLSIRSAITGVSVATLAAPKGGFFGPAATGDGRSYVVAVTRTGQCGAQLLQFKISNTGQPSRLASFKPGGEWRQAIDFLAISRNGRTVAFAGFTCQRPGARADAGPGKADIGVLVTKQVSKTAYTGRGTYWPVPSQSFVNSLSLTADGRQIEFSTDLSARFASNVYVLPTNAASGSALRRSRVIAEAAAFGAPTAISGSVMTPDGKTVYFATYKTGRAFNGRWALRAVDVSSGRSRLITEKRGFGVHIVANPPVRELIAFVQAGPIQPPVPIPSPSPSHSQLVPSGSPSPVPIVSPSGSPSPTPVFSGSPSPVPTSSTSPSPVPTRSPSPVGSTSTSPVPSSSPAIAPQASATLDDALLGPFDVIRIQLPGGRIRYLNPVPWDPAGFFYIW